MKSIFVLLIILTSPFFVFAQSNVDSRIWGYGTDLIGFQNDRKTSAEIVGSIFLNDNWTNAIIQTQSGKVYKNLEVKYNVLNDEVYFLGKNDSTMKFKDPIKEFSLIPEHKSPKVFRSGFPRINDYDKDSFYEVLTEGKVSLLKKSSKRITDRRDYVPPVTTYEIIGNTKYFLYQEGKMRELKKDKAFILSCLGNKKEVNRFVETNNVDVKNEVHLIALLNFYNAL